jgi:hypothetical protein
VLSYRWSILMFDFLACAICFNLLYTLLDLCCPCLLDILIGTTELNFIFGTGRFNFSGRFLLRSFKLPPYLQSLNLSFISGMGST